MSTHTTRVLAILAVVGLVVTAFTTPTHPEPESARGVPSSTGSASLARHLLDRLSVRDPDSPDTVAGYDRSLFPHWSTVEARCDARQWTLLRDGYSVRAGPDCRISHGLWYSAYDNSWVGSAHQVDIDHLVPLSDAWRSGAHVWDTQQRREFANDISSPQLWAVSAASNRSKGDRSPDEWMPPHDGARCDYAKAWVRVKHTWGLSVTETELGALRTALEEDC